MSFTYTGTRIEDTPLHHILKVIAYYVI